MSDLKIVKTHHQRGLWKGWKVALFLGEEEASRLWVVVKPIRIGSATVTIGGIAGVGTPEKYRMKGYASRVMDASTELMVEQRYEMGWLYGIRDFYHRFGYAVGFPTVMFEVDTDSLKQARSMLSVRAMKKADGPAVRRLYNRLNGLRTGTVVRPSGWSGFELAPGFQRPGSAVVAVNTGGQVRRYATYLIRDNRFDVGEIGGVDRAALETLARTLGNRARRAGVESLRFQLSEDDVFAAFCVRFGCQKQVIYPANGGAMGRIMCLRPLMGKLAPELSRRLVKANFSWRGTLVLETNIGSVGLRIDGTSVTVARTSSRRSVRVKIPQMRLTQWIMGYRSVEDVAYEVDVQVPRRARDVLVALFPVGAAYMWWSDRF